MKPKENHRNRLKKHAWTTLGYLVIATLALIGSITVRERANADEQIVVTARVGDVVEGPTTPAPTEESSEDGTDDSDSSDKEKKSSPSAPTVSVEPSSRGGAAFALVSDAQSGKQIAQFTSSRPAFEGSTTIKNTLITLVFKYENFTFRSRASANEKGEWYWQSPEAFPDGRFILTITAQNRRTPAIQAAASVQFRVLSGEAAPGWTASCKQKAESGHYEVLAEISDPYRSVAPGEEVVTSLRFTALEGTTQAAELPVEYEVRNEAGEKIMENRETLTVADGTAYLKSFYTKPQLKEGKYELVVRVPQCQLLAVSSASFDVNGPSSVPMGSVGKIDYTLVFQVLLGMMFLFILLTYFEFMRFLAQKRRLEPVTDNKLKSFF